MAGVAKLFGGHIINKSNKEVDLCRKKYRGKIIGLYFSAQWHVWIFFYENLFECINLFSFS